MSAYHPTFVSHAHADNDLCDRYVNALRARGIDIWYDRNNAQAGNILANEIEEQLKKRAAFVLLMSEHALKSYWVDLEVNAYRGLMAKDRSRKLLPVRIGPCQVPPLLDVQIWIDALSMPFDKVIDEIVDGLTTKSTSQPPIPAQRRSSKFPAALPPATLRNRQVPLAPLPLPSLLSYPDSSRPTDIAGNTALPPKVARPSPTRWANPLVTSSSINSSRAWIRVGSTPVGKVGKAMLSLGFAELFWGVLVITYSAINTVTKGNNFPTVAFGVVWLTFLLLVGTFVGIAISRPVYRRKRVSGFRRALQAWALAIYTIVSIVSWAVITNGSTLNTGIHLLATFVLLGANMLLIGILTILNMVNN